MNKILIIALSIVLSLPITIWADDSISTNTTLPAINTIDEEIEPIESESEAFKQPISKKKIIKKFLAAMGGVAISSFAIFFMLSGYNKIRENFENNVKTPDGEVSLETPEDLNSAVRTFLEKTKW